MYDASSRFETACEQEAAKVLVVIVTFNTRSLALDTLRSLFAQTIRTSLEVVVVDNGSVDGTPDAIRREFAQRVNLIQLGSNPGFAAANNIGVAESSGDWEFVLLLNPDTIVLRSSVDLLVDFARSGRFPDAWVWGGRQLFKNGELDPTCVWALPSIRSALGESLGLRRVLRHSKVFNPSEYPGWNRDSERCVGVITGCFMLVRGDIWRRLDGLDAGFFLYSEETDFCKRVHLAGGKVAFTPSSEIIHIGAGADPPGAGKLSRTFAGKVRYFRKHHRLWQLVAWGFLFGSAARWLGCRMVGKKQSAKVWRGVLLSARSWVSGEYS